MNTKKSLLLLFSALLLFTMVFSMQKVTLAEDPETVYLPVLFKAITGGEPIAPADGSVLTTLVPEFVFKVGPIPENGYAVLHYDTKPNLDPTDYSFGLGGGEQDSETTFTVSYFHNFEPNTVYYWHAGIINDWNSNVIQWGPTWSFTTGANGTLPGVAILDAPAPGASLTQIETTFSWQAVPGASSYLLWTCSENSCYISSTTEPFRSFNLYWRDPGTYTWYVTAKNDYGYGPMSEQRNFTLIGTVNQIQAEGASAPQPTGLFVQPDGKSIQFYR